MSEKEALHRLLNLRKKGSLSHLKSRRTVFDDSEYRFAAEIALRYLERKLQSTLDQIICDPDSAAEFDRICNDICPGFESLHYRWAAFSLRKSRKVSPEILGHAIPPEDVILLRCNSLEIDRLPVSQGLYVFSGGKAVLYVGEAHNLKNRIRKHLEHSDNKLLARYIWDLGLDELVLELHVLPAETATKVRRAMEVELIRSRNPAFNILGTS